MSELNKRDEALSKEAVSSDKSQKKAKTPAKKKDKPNRLVRWLKDMRGELKKVTWPSKKDLINYTLLVLAFIVFMGVVIGLLDLGASELVKALINI